MRMFKLPQMLPKIPKLLLRGELKFEFEKLPFEARNISRKKAANFILAGLNQYLLPSRPFGYPIVAQVEPANYCNLECPLCLTTSITHARPRALLSFASFKRFIDECGDYLLLIILWCWGEPFLNKDLIRMISYAKARGIIVHTSTNGNVPLSEERLEALVDSGLDSLVVAVDGASQEVYAKYRQGGELDRVISNIQNILRVRSLKGSATPRLSMRFVVMRHNEAELPLVRSIASQLGVDFLSLKTVDMPTARGLNLDKAYIPRQNRYRRYDYNNVTFERRMRPFQCMRPWKRITLEASGEVIACEYDYTNEISFGNIQGKGTLASWKSEESRNFRCGFKLGNNDYPMCEKCTYKNSVADDCTVECVRYSYPKHENCPGPRV